MKLHAASKKEIKRMALGTLICLGGMLAVFFILSLFSLARFDYRVVLGGVIGTGVAVGNFAAMCVTIQNAAQTGDKKQMQAKLQLSYNGRLIIQAAWVVAAFLIPWVNVVAAALPLLFPSLVILFLRGRGTLTTPGDRKADPDAQQSEDRPDSFQV